MQVDVIVKAELSRSQELGEHSSCHENSNVISVLADEPSMLLPRGFRDFGSENLRDQLNECSNMP